MTKRRPLGFARSFRILIGVNLNRLTLRLRRGYLHKISGRRISFGTLTPSLNQDTKVRLISVGTPLLRRPRCNETRLPFSGLTRTITRFARLLIRVLILLLGRPLNFLGLTVNFLLNNN